MLPSQIEEYRIVRELGSGGMGTVYEAVHIKRDLRVAIKVVRPEHVRDLEIEQRFLKEARALSCVTHPGIVEIYSFGVLDDGSSYLVMELLAGETLAQRWKRGREPDLIAELQLLQPVAEVLAMLHRSGVVHRDLKPDNIMIVSDPTTPTGQRAKLVDFGLAKLTRFSGRRSQSGLIMGTPAYMSPEQCRGAGQVDDRTDCYALGVMLYELVSGRLPFESQWAGDLIGMHLHVEPEPLEQRVPNVEPRFSEFIHALLNKNKNQRPEMAEAAKQLAELVFELEQQAAARIPPCDTPEDALAQTMLGLEVQDSQRTEPDQAIEELREEPARGGPPSQSELDGLFALATLARVLDGGIQRGEPIGKRVLLTLKPAELPALKRALSIHEQSAQQHCTCLGDLTIELCGAAGRLGLFSYHYHDIGLLGYADWDRDAQLVKADAFLLLLGRHGVTAPGRKLFAEAAMKRKVEKQQQIMLGEAHRVPKIAQAEPRAVLDGKLLLSRLTDGQTDADFDFCIQFLSTQLTLSSRAGLLARIPERRWEQLLLHVKSQGLHAKLPFVEHAQRVGQALDTAAKLARRGAGAELTRIVHCQQGPLSTLVTDGVDLYGIAEHKLVRMAPFDGQFETVMSLPAPDFVLSCCGPSLFFTCTSAGTVGQIRLAKGRARLEVLASGRSSPNRPTHCGWRPHWLERISGAAGSQRALMRLKRQDYSAEVTQVATMGEGAADLLGDDEFLYALDPLSDGTMELKWFSQEGLPFQSVKSPAPVAPRHGLSLLAQSAMQVFWPAEDRILAARKLRLETSVRAIASGPVALCAPTEIGVYALIGRAADPVWQVEFAPADQTATLRIGAFEHRESDSVAAVTLGETLYFSCGASLYLARAK